MKGQAKQTVVFAGPSIHGLDRAPFSAMTFKPPAAAGDVLAAVRSGARIIGLIDGLYGDCAAVWHKELLYALSRGIIVIGAASMGALRAVECEMFGMLGLGQVFEQYRLGTRVSDADVALSHGPAELDFCPLTVSLVDAEATIEGLRDTLDQTQCQRLIAAARSVHFSRRTWKAVVALAGYDADIASTCARNMVSVKKADALLLLQMVQDGGMPGAAPPEWTFQETVFFRNLLACQEPGDETA
ncbi:TfuA-like core domain-containing protein [Rhizobium sp. PDO1-076]|uniref:TfuA-like protein n=1 Tax=Rhizobium sp. PDO1-076 TaxID=1125979 RepID=UPI00024E2590|nr:TfuA-like protein [Rhizobium sp. PDO1-076]EHS52394.1 TfuA-like core domain-containing protein [Rhizobium sp. PDO1-076]